jgi:hypothetical protein
MNGRNAFSLHHSTAFNGQSRARTTRRRKAANAWSGKTWFPGIAAVPDPELREVVAQRFMSMNKAHDRIRAQLLASRAKETS